MKILQVNKYHHDQGGANRYYLELSRALTEEGHDVVHFSMQDERNEPSPFSEYFVENVDFNRPGSLFDQAKRSMRVIYFPQARRMIRKIVERYTPEIAHLHNIYHHLSPSFLPVLEERGIPVVMTAHDYKLICPNYTLFDGRNICEKCRGGKSYQVLLSRCYPGSFPKGITLAVEAYLHKLLGTYSKCLDVIIVPSRFMKETMVRFGIPEKKISFIPNFVDPVPTEIQNGSGEYILYFGRLAREKGLPTLIGAMQSYSEISLVIAGDGPARSDLERMCVERKILNVDFVGRKNAREIIRLIEGSRFTVLPSVWYENCPLSVLESMAHGKPVVGADIGGIPDLIDDGTDGLLFEAGNEADLGEKIGRLVKDREFCVELGRKGYQKVKEFYNKEVHCRSVLSVYEKLLDDRRTFQR